MFVILMTRVRLLTAAAGFVTLAVLLGHPTLAKSVGADVWNIPALNEQIRESADASEHLDAEDAEVRRRIAVKEALVSELIAGRTTLAEVTTRFGEINASRPEYVNAIRASYPGATDQEKTANNVISYALARVSDPDRAALAQRLDDELDLMTTHSSAH